MKSHRATPKEYATALFDLTSEQQVLDQIIFDLEAVEKKLRADHNLRAVLNNPQEEIASKKDNLQKVFQDFISQYTYNFLYLLLENNELDLLTETLTHLKKLMKEKSGILELTVTSAIPLTEEERNRVSEKFSQKTGQRVFLEAKVDPEIIGGLVLRANDDIIDLSLRGKINSLKSQFEKDNLPR